MIYYRYSKYKYVFLFIFVSAILFSGCTYKNRDQSELITSDRKIIDFTVKNIDTIPNIYGIELTPDMVKFHVVQFDVSSDMDSAISDSSVEGNVSMIAGEKLISVSISHPGGSAKISDKLKCSYYGDKKLISKAEAALGYDFSSVLSINELLNVTVPNEALYTRIDIYPLLKHYGVYDTYVDIPNGVIFIVSDIYN